MLNKLTHTLNTEELHTICFSLVELNQTNTCKLLEHSRSRFYSEHQRSFPWPSLSNVKVLPSNIKLQFNHYHISPQMMSRVHSVTKGKMLSSLFLTTAWRNLFTRMRLCSSNTCRKSSRILKWNAGVKSFLRPCHLLPIRWRNLKFLVDGQQKIYWITCAC